MQLLEFFDTFFANYRLQTAKSRTTTRTVTRPWTIHRLRYRNTTVRRLIRALRMRDCRSRCPKLYSNRSKRSPNFSKTGSKFFENLLTSGFAQRPKSISFNCKSAVRRRFSWRNEYFFENYKNVHKIIRKMFYRL